MIYTVTYQNPSANSVKVAYINRDKEVIVENLTVKENDVWQTNIDYDGDLIYKFIINNQYHINDFNAQEYIFADKNQYWSVLKENGTRSIKRDLPNLVNSIICTDITPEGQPIGITRIVKPIHNNIICALTLLNVCEDTLVTTIWKNKLGEYLINYDLLITPNNKKTNEYIAFSGIYNIKDLLSANVIEDGKWIIEIYFNGIYMDKDEFNVQKYEIYTYNKKLSKKNLVY